uniref:Uncharacterized protein n=1 Tax=Oryza sativa subsp. japonica TaxID=39947 RepID=Q5VMJ4_ORYSJ|nr:hypothetical protein [Oryza sativa Japonica Group]BAD69331.1 hypothetical protein [Oryza sativa Japonica Group]
MGRYALRIVLSSDLLPTSKKKQIMSFRVQHLTGREKGESAMAVVEAAGGRRGVAAGERRKAKAKEAAVGAMARALFYPTLLYNVVRSKVQAEFRWWDEVDQVSCSCCRQLPAMLLSSSCPTRIN